MIHGTVTYWLVHLALWAFMGRPRIPANYTRNPKCNRMTDGSVMGIFMGALHSLALRGPTMQTISPAHISLATASAWAQHAQHEQGLASSHLVSLSPTYNADCTHECPLQYLAARITVRLVLGDVPSSCARRTRRILNACLAQCSLHRSWGGCWVT